MKSTRTEFLRKSMPFLIAALSYLALLRLGGLITGPLGLGEFWVKRIFESHPLLAPLLYLVLMAHITISAMSICFHRQHTHQGVKLSPALDIPMQLWLWAVTSMSKRDWVSVHIYHHAHSDQPLDPHSPVQKGLFRVLFLGVVDYARAKGDPQVLKIRARIPETRLETFLDRHLLLGPILLTTLNVLVAGPFWGSLLSLLNFSVSPIFAVGGVNALAHWFGYRNYRTTDNSRNLGFLFPLNWIICGELDHNNHHRHPRSASFAHRWFEFDVGYLYLRIFELLGLAEIRHAQTDRQSWILSPEASLKTPSLP